MTKAVIYARYSSHNQRDASIEDQVRVCREDAERRGDEIVGIYADRAVSGTSDRRDQFQKMISDAVLDAQEAAMADEYDERAALEKRIDSIGRERSRLIDLVAKIGADDEVAAKIGELKDEREAAEAELDELMRGAPVVTREHVLFWAREMARKDDPRELIPAFVDRVVVGDECVRVEFRLRELMPEGVGSDLLDMAGVPGFEPR